MTTTWVPGYLGDLKLATDSFGLVGNTISFGASKNNQTKPVFGTSYMDRVVGKRDATIDGAGHIAAEEPVAKLFALFESDDPIAFEIQIGEAGGATDGGTITGNAVVSDYTIDADADGEWDWSVTLETVGTYSHTPPAP